MLTSSFLFAQGITEDMERAIWARGVTSWEILRKYPGEAAEVIGDSRSQKLLAAVAEAETARVNGDYAWFRKHWPEKSLWRLWKGFCAPEQVALVDIETTGRTPGYDNITVIGLANGVQEYAFVAGRPQANDQAIEEYLEAIKAYHLLITFNGVSFDVPFIEKHFAAQGYHVEQPHLDLIWPARSIGLSGGLKDMEKQVGIVREEDIADVRGAEAITLWGQWTQRNDRAAYDRLVTYCKADCTNLQPFAEHIYNRKWEECYGKHAQEIDLDATHGEQMTLF